MAAFAGPSFCEKGPRLMSKKPSRTVTPATAGNVPAPVRVRLKRINSDYARPYPPDGQAREWWHRLKNAFGTASSAFVDASLQQLIAAARLPFDGISELVGIAAAAERHRRCHQHGKRNHVAERDGQKLARIAELSATPASQRFDGHRDPEDEHHGSQDNCRNPQAAVDVGAASGHQRGLGDEQHDP